MAIINDEKTQAELSGVLVGKATLSPQAFTVWTAIFTILSAAVIKSVTKSPDAYAKSLDAKYQPIFDEIQSLDFNNPRAATQAARRLKALFEESGLEITDAEAAQIFREIYTNRDKLENTLRNVSQSFYEFKQVFND